jgi:hypothetical protein
VPCCGILLSLQDGGEEKSAKQEKDELIMGLLLDEVLPKATTLYLAGPLQVRLQPPDASTHQHTAAAAAAAAAAGAVCTQPAASAASFTFSWRLWCVTCCVVLCAMLCHAVGAGAE